MLLRLAAVSLSLSCLAPLVHAQEPPTAPRVSGGEVLGVGWNDGEGYAVSRSYVARFDPCAVELTPGSKRAT